MRQTKTSTFNLNTIYGLLGTLVFGLLLSRVLQFGYNNVFSMKRTFFIGLVSGGVAFSLISWQRTHSYNLGTFIHGAFVGMAAGVVMTIIKFKVVHPPKKPA